MAKGKRTTSTKSKTVEPTTPVVESTPVAENTVVAQQTEVEPTMSDSFSELLSQLSQMRSQITTLSAQIRALKTRSEREIKLAHKQAKKRRSANRKPSGFVKPTLISDELATFLGKPKGTEMARTEVTREINKYINAHNLKNPENGRHILADSKLRKLLKLGKSDELTYFNLQKYMSPHFSKSTATA